MAEKVVAGTDGMFETDELHLEELSVTSMRDAVALAETGASSITLKCSSSSCCGSTSCCVEA